eukprot:g3533.t1
MQQRDSAETSVRNEALLCEARSRQQAAESKLMARYCGRSRSEYEERRQQWFHLFRLQQRIVSLTQGDGPACLSDLALSGCHWTSTMLDRYLSTKDFSAFAPAPAPIDDKLWNCVRARVKLSLQALRSRARLSSSPPPETAHNATQRSLAAWLSELPARNEAASRILIDALLAPLCVSAGCQLVVEPTYRQQLFPTNRLDYQVFSRTGHPLGLIEAKAPYSFSPNGLTQILIQLFQQESITSVAKATRPRFGVFTDGVSFLFLCLGPSRLTATCKVQISRVHIVRQWTELRHVACILYGLLSHQ